MEDFAEIVSDRLQQLGASPITTALAAGLNRDAIRSVLRGREPSVKKARQICEALGLEFYIGALRSVSAGRSPAPPGRRTAVRDPRLASMLAVLADAWDELNPAGQRDLEVRFWAHFPDLKRRAARANRIITWLGWRTLDGIGRTA